MTYASLQELLTAAVLPLMAATKGITPKRNVEAEVNNQGCQYDARTMRRAARKQGFAWLAGE